jgi:hypothetical protein|nr:MAG TPA: ATP dependent helicase [Caudoviricetes sp.]
MSTEGTDHSFKLTAVIPTAQYANLQPEIETTGKSYEEAQELALQRMTELWNRVCEPGKELHVGQKVATPTEDISYERVASGITGVEVLFDPITHSYKGLNGEDYLSGSAFASKYKSEFDAARISSAMADKYKVPAHSITSMWNLNGEVSTSLGTAVHNALELYGKYLQLSNAIKGTDESALTKNEIIRPLVQSFFKDRENEKAGYEVFVANESHRLCGFIDRLLIVDEEKRICRVQDYKTNHSIERKETILPPFKGVVESTVLGAYWLQLSFYAYILQQAGWTVQGLDIFNWEGGEWKTYQHDVIDISKEVDGR